MIEVDTIYTEAADQYGRDYRATLADEGLSLGRLAAIERLKDARRHLTTPEVALLDLVGARGWRIEEVARRFGRDIGSLLDLYAIASTKLAHHYGIAE